MLKLWHLHKGITLLRDYQRKKLKVLWVLLLVFVSNETYVNIATDKESCIRLHFKENGLEIYDVLRKVLSLWCVTLL